MHKRGERVREKEQCQLRRRRREASDKIRRWDKRGRETGEIKKKEREGMEHANKRIAEGKRGNEKKLDHHGKTFFN